MREGSTNESHDGGLGVGGADQGQPSAREARGGFTKARAEDGGLRVLCYASALYDLALALPLLFAPEAVAQLFGAPAPSPVVNAQLNGVFTFTLALGYVWAAERRSVRRGYVWLAGVLAKSLGAMVFVIDHLLRDSPASFLLFALCDGTLAVASFVLLVRARRAR